MNLFEQIFQPVIRKINTRSYVKFSIYRDINVLSKKYYDNDTLSKYSLKHSINYYEDNNQKKLEKISLFKQSLIGIFSRHFNIFWM